MLYGWKENSMLTNCLAECAHLAITVSQIERDIGRKWSFSYSPVAFDAPVKEVPNFPSEHRHPVWYGKTRMAWLPDGKRFRRYLYSFWRNSRTWQTDGHRVTAYTALMHMHRAVKTALEYYWRNEANYWPTRNIARPLCDSRAFCYHSDDANAIEFCEVSLCQDY